MTLTHLPRPTAKRAALALLAFCLATAVAAPAGAEHGGPDAAGYSYKDSAELGGPSYYFQDISGSGTPLSLPDDGVSDPLAIGFPFPFYGVSQSQVRVSSNGFLLFGSGTDSGCCEGPWMGTGSGPGNVVAAYWTDLYPPGGGSIHTQSTPSAFTVQFKDVPLYGSSATVRFQVKLFPSGAIEVHYASAVADGHVASAGIQNADASVGLQYRHGEFDLAQVAVRYGALPSASTPSFGTCGDLVDNDGDGLADFPLDPGCSSPSDSSERGSGVCDDGSDNDGDGLADAPADPGCGGPSDTDERSAAACDDGLDNDGDGTSDLGDAGCDGPADGSERGTLACDDGLDNDGDGQADYRHDTECLSATDDDEGGAFYSASFGSGTAGTEWSPRSVATAPRGERFLGRFGNQQAVLALSVPKPHTRLTVAFDLYIVETWDGHGGPYQSTSDEWRLLGPGGQTLVDTTFSNCFGETQDYPSSFGQAANGAAYGAVARGTLGYSLVCFGDEGYGDATYHIEASVDHAGPAASFTFQGIGLQSLDDESWGVDNVSVTAS